MDRTIEISGSWFAYLSYAALLAVLVAFLFSTMWARGGFGNAPLAVLLAFLALATVVGVWREMTDRDGEHLETADDIVHDPLAPGRMAKERWRKSIRLYSGGDDDED